MALTGVEARAAEERRISEMRKAALQKEISRYVNQGYRVTAQTDYTAQLLKPKVFSRLWAFLWFLCLGVGLLVYLLWYWSKRDKQIYLSVDEGGKAHVKK